MPNEITARDLWLINAYERRELTSDDAYVFTIKLCDNDVDRDGERFTVESLNMLKELFVGGMGIVDHNPKNKNITARILKCDVKQVPTRTTATGECYYYLTARAYVKRSAESEKLISSIESGELNEVSIGCAVSATVCSICGEEIQVCPHKKGHYYNGRLCCGELISPYEAYEWSFVAKPKAAMSEPKSITPEAAIIELNRCKVNGYMPIDWDRRGRAIERANAALRKQIPQKLIVTTSTKRCPSCNKQLTNKGCIHSKYNYCKWCGQALDWGEGKADG